MQKALKKTLDFFLDMRKKFHPFEDGPNPTNKELWLG